MPLHCSVRWGTEWRKNQVNITHGFGLTLADKTVLFLIMIMPIKNSSNKKGYLGFVGSQPTLLLFDAYV